MPKLKALARRGFGNLKWPPVGGVGGWRPGDPSSDAFGWTRRNPKNKLPSGHLLATKRVGPICAPCNNPSPLTNQLTWISFKPLLALFIFNGRGIIFTAVFICFPPVDVPDLGCSEGKATLAYQLLVREGENVGRTLSDSNWLSPAYSKKKKVLEQPPEHHQLWCPRRRPNSPPGCRHYFLVRLPPLKSRTKSIFAIFSNELIWTFYWSLSLARNHGIETNEHVRGWNENVLSIFIDYFMFTNQSQWITDSLAGNTRYDATAQITRNEMNKQIKLILNLHNETH